MDTFQIILQTDKISYLYFFQIVNLLRRIYVSPIWVGEGGGSGYCKCNSRKIHILLVSSIIFLILVETSFLFVLDYYRQRDSLYKKTDKAHLQSLQLLLCHKELRVCYERMVRSCLRPELELLLMRTHLDIVDRTTWRRMEHLSDAGHDVLPQ